MGKHRLIAILLLTATATCTGCAYRHFLGMHGPSIRNHAEAHDVSLKDDAECLSCHSPKNSPSDAPPTSHPTFTGCLKCHNDPPAS